MSEVSDLKERFAALEATYAAAMAVIETLRQKAVYQGEVIKVHSRELDARAETIMERDTTINRQADAAARHGRVREALANVRVFAGEIGNSGEIVFSCNGRCKCPVTIGESLAAILDRAERGESEAR